MIIGRKLESQINFVLGTFFMSAALLFGTVLFFAEKDRYETKLMLEKFRVESVVGKYENRVAEMYFAGREKNLRSVLQKITAEKKIVGAGLFEADGRLVEQCFPDSGPDLKEIEIPLKFSLSHTSFETPDFGRLVVFTKPLVSEKGPTGLICAVYSPDRFERGFVKSTAVVISIFLTLQIVGFFVIRKFLYRSVIFPVRDLTGAMDAFQWGDPAKCSATGIDNELGYAAWLFQCISEENAGIYKKLTQLNLALEEKVRERTRQSDEANRAKSAFLANMSHELRTPLNAILGFTGIIGKHPNLPEEIVEQLSIVRRSGEYLLLLINDVLDLSKIEAGQMDLKEAPLDLHRMIRELEKMFGMKAVNKRLDIEFELADDLPKYILADELKLKQILINFIDNAIKFTSEGGIYFRAKVLEKGMKGFVAGSKILYFEVEDTGAGISPEERKDLFKAFVQTRSGQKSKQGTGLGLSISYRYIKMMKGEIDVRSTPEEGSVFSFEIPLSMASMDDREMSERMRSKLEQDCPGRNEMKSMEKMGGSADGVGLGEISPHLLKELEEASRICDVGEVEDCIERIRKVSSALAAEFSELAADFDFDIIVERIKSEQPRSEERGTPNSTASCSGPDVEL